MKKINRLKKLSREQSLVSLFPPATVDLGTRGTFNQEAYYQYSVDRQISFPMFNKNYGDVSYGKKNSDGITILPLGRNLKQVKIVKNGPFCLNFVSDAYEDFFVIWSKYIRDGRVLEAPEFSINAINGYENFEERYLLQIEQHYQLFQLYLSANKQNDNIRNFDNFLKLFSYYTRLNAFVNPITASYFVSSTKCSPFVSGLVLSVSNSPLNYETKTNWINHPNFQLFNETANLYGFTVDKNIPWHLYFNVISPAAKIYIDRYITKDLYSESFLKVFDYDLYFLQKSIYNMYTKFVDSNPKFRKVNYKICDSEVRSQIETFDRQVLDQTQINIMLKNQPSQEWIRFFVFVKACENRATWNQDQFDSVSEDVYTLWQSLDKEAALGYLQRKLREDRGKTVKQINFSF